MNSSASIPLTEALPWPSPPPSDGRLFLVCDSIETDGRFLLHTLSSQVFSSSGRVFWVACGPWTDALIVTALKKMGCETAATTTTSAAAAAAANLRDGSTSTDNTRTPPLLTIRSVPVDMATRLEENADAADADFDAELYLKELYHSIRSWTSDWIVMDDVSALATLVGERLAYCFVLSLRALVKQTKTCSIMVRCSHDYDMDILKEQQDTASVHAGCSRRRHVDWVGAGGVSKHVHDVTVPWERALPELADGIVNVEPLASGYSREAHGRLVFCSIGRGWGQSNTTTNSKMIQEMQGGPSNTTLWIPLVLNFTCQDTTVSAIRLTRPVNKRHT